MEILLADVEQVQEIRVIIIRDLVVALWWRGIEEIGEGVVGLCWGLRGANKALTNLEVEQALRLRLPRSTITRDYPKGQRHDARLDSACDNLNSQ